MPGAGELWIILIVVLVLFGGSQLPKLAKNLGKAQREFKAGMDEASSEKTDADADDSTKPESKTPES